MTNTIEILTNVFDKLKKRVSVLSIVDNLDNTYTLTLSEVYLLYHYNSITISANAEINGLYRIVEVNETNKTVKIELQSGKITIVEAYAYAENYVYYLFESFGGAKNEILKKNISQNFVLQKMPFILCLTDFNETVNGTLHAPNISIFLIQKSEQNKSNNWRNENTLLFLRNMQSELYKQLNYNDNILSFIDFSKTEYFFDGSNTDNSNKLDAVIDVIEFSPKINLITKSKNF